MSKIFGSFFENLKNHPDSPAFVYWKGSRMLSRTYAALYNDIKKAAAHLKTSGFRSNDNVLLLLKPSYDFYVFLLAGFVVGYKTVLVEDFSDAERLKRKIELATVNKLLCSKMTGILRRFIKPLKGLPAFSTRGYQSAVPAGADIEFDAGQDALITFTSGGSGKPKAVLRSLGDLERQMQLINNNLKGLSPGDRVIMMLPVYPLAGLAAGVTNILFFENENRRGYAHHFFKMAKSADAVIASVSKYIKLGPRQHSIKKVFTGGSIIFPDDAQAIKHAFPGAAITYIYGSTEAALISVTDLDGYITALGGGQFCLGRPADGIGIFTDNDGEIMLGGDYVLQNYLKGGDNSDVTLHGSRQYVRTGDIGMLADGKLFIKGRKNLSDLSGGIYNYETELEVLVKYKPAQRPAFISTDGHNVLFLVNPEKGTADAVKRGYPDFIIESIDRLPLDERHHYKTDYVKLKELADEAIRKQSR